MTAHDISSAALQIVKFAGNTLFSSINLKQHLFYHARKQSCWSVTAPPRMIGKWLVCQPYTCCLSIKNRNLITSYNRVLQSVMCHQDVQKQFVVNRLSYGSFDSEVWQWLNHRNKQTDHVCQKTHRLCDWLTYLLGLSVVAIELSQCDCWRTWLVVLNDAW